MSSSRHPPVRLDWCTHKAAASACKYWHYSGCMPTGKTVKIGVWEDSQFVGVIIFSLGANNHLVQKQSTSLGIRFTSSPAGGRG